MGLLDDKCAVVLRALVPPEDSYDFHVGLIRHGRRVCIARNPRCGVCVLQDLCDYYCEQLPDLSRADTPEAVPT